MRKATLPRLLYDFFTRKWALSTLLLTSSTLWFSLLKMYGQPWGLLDASGAPVPIAGTITWVFAVTSLVFAIVKTKADQYDEVVKQNGEMVLREVLENITSAKVQKLNRFCEYIKRNRNAKGLVPFQDITQPRQQIETILGNLQVTLSKLCDLPRGDIGLSIVFRLDGSEWHWLCSVNTDHGLNLAKLVDNPNTTARQIIDGKKASLFFPDKRTGYRLNQYVPSPRDGEDMVGSVLCRDLSLGDDDYVHAVLSITTYGKQLCGEEDGAARSKIEDLIVRHFERRLQVELALLYIKEVLV